MAEKETIILDFQVDQGSAIQELEKTKKSIIQLKEEQAELNKAYKAGNVTLEEYVSETVRLEGILKKQQSTYTNTQKSVTGVKTKMDDLIASNNKLAASIKESTENIKIGGTSISDLTTKVTSLLNPVTAAAAVVTGLGIAYANSARGANDLANAQNNLRAGLETFFNRVGNETDGGVLERLSRRLNIAAVNLTSNTKEDAEARKDRLRIAEIELKTLRDLEIDRIEAVGRQKIREKEAEKARIIRDNQEKSFTERLKASEKVAENINGIETETVDILQKQINALISYGENTGAIVNGEIIDRKLNLEILNLKNEISDKQEFVAGKLTENINAERSITAELKKQNLQRDDNRKKLEQDIKFKSGGDTGDIAFSDDPAKSKEFDVQEQFEKDKELIDETLGLTVTAEEKKRAELLRTNALKDELAEEDRRRFEESAQLMEDNFNTLAGLFSQGSEARRLFALAGIGADTAQAISSLTAMSEANPANAFTFGGAGIAQYASGIIRILANIVAAKQFLGGEFGGGGDFVTTKPTMIMVGDNPGGRERVTVEPLSGKGKTTYNPQSGFARFAGGGSMTFDGAKELAVQTIQQNLQLRNAIKNQPAPVVSWREGQIIGKRVTFKENLSKR